MTKDDMMNKKKSDMELLYKNLKYAQNREWLNSYLDLIKMFLDATGIKNNDKRLDMTFSATPPFFLSVVVNWRFIIVAEGAKKDKNKESSVQLLFKSNYRDFPEFRDNPSIIKKGQFNQLTGEKSKPPYYLQFYDLNELLSILNNKRRVYDFWVESISEEMNRAEASPSRDAHKPMFYKFVTDKKYRAVTLDGYFSARMKKEEIYPDEVNEPQEYSEGATKIVSINAYERNAKARSVCVKHYGATCAVCGMNFQSRYGSLGEGFIHVHHLKPLGEIGRKYTINPIEEMRPVCPNCHAVLHMRNPPFSIKEVKEMLKK